jgi:hypothetical protein
MGNEDAENWFRKCREVFVLLEEFCGRKHSAAEILRRTWFEFDGKTPPVIPDHFRAEIVGWLNRARMILQALKESGFFTR